MKKIRLALAGVWHVHTPMYLTSVEKEFGDKVEWLYVYEENEERAKSFCERLHAEYTNDLDVVLQDPRVDAVICEAETCKHKDIVVRAAKAGKAVYTDKVLTISSDDAEEVKRAVEESGVKFCVSHEVIPYDAYQYIKKIIVKGLSVMSYPCTSADLMAPQSHRKTVMR